MVSENPLILSFMVTCTFITEHIDVVPNSFSTIDLYLHLLAAGGT